MPAELVGDDAGAVDLAAAPGPLIRRIDLAQADRLPAIEDRNHQRRGDALDLEGLDLGRIAIRVVDGHLHRLLLTQHALGGRKVGHEPARAPEDAAHVAHQSCIAP